MKKGEFLEPHSKEWNDVLCCISIEERTAGSFFQNVVGPLRQEDAEKQLKEWGFIQHRPNLWLQDFPMSMNYCGTQVSLKDAKAWVHDLQRPEDINLLKT